MYTSTSIILSFLEIKKVKQIIKHYASTQRIYIHAHMQQHMGTYHNVTWLEVSEQRACFRRWQRLTLKTFDRFHLVFSAGMKGQPHLPLCYVFFFFFLYVDTGNTNHFSHVARVSYWRGEVIKWKRMSAVTFLFITSLTPVTSGSYTQAYSSYRSCALDVKSSLRGEPHHNGSRIISWGT